MTTNSVKAVKEANPTMTTLPCHNCTTFNAQNVLFNRGQKFAVDRETTFLILPHLCLNFAYDSSPSNIMTVHLQGSFDKYVSEQRHTVSFPNTKNPKYTFFMEFNSEYQQ